MFNNNYYKMLAYSVNGVAPNFVATEGTVTSYAAWSNIYSMMGKPYYESVGTYWHSFSGVSFGDGDTPPTRDDYFLSGSQITAMTAVASVSTSKTDDSVTIKGIYTITNIGSEEITIKEVGLFPVVKSATLGGHIMIERTVLDNPVTIPVGGFGQVEYTITFNLPTT